MLKRRKITRLFFAIALTGISFDANALFGKSDKIQDANDSFGSRLNNTLTRSIDACNATLCDTMDGIRNCFESDAEYANYSSGDKFFKKLNGTFVYRKVPVVVARKITKVNDSGVNETYEEPVTIEKVVNIISPTAYKAFLKVAKANPNCLKRFCINNCLIVDKVNDVDVKNQVEVFKGAAASFIIRGKEFKPDDLRKMAEEDEANNTTNLYRLAQEFVLDRRNTVISMKCLSETGEGVKMRMMCARCSETLGANLGQISKACGSFSETQNVNFDILKEEKEMQHQEQLAELKRQQEIAFAEQASNGGDLANLPGARLGTIG